MTTKLIDGYVGLILAAGFGTRLKPYTDHIPKPLLPFCGVPIINHAVRRLLSSGISDIIINTHHLHEQIEDFIKANYIDNKNNVLTGNTGNTHMEKPNIYLSYEPQILGTGGVYSKIKDRIDGRNTVVYNSDIISDIDIKALILAHKTNPERISTMVVTDYKEGTTPVYIRDDGNLLGIGDIYERKENDRRERDLGKIQKSSFCAVSIVSPSLIALLPQEGFSSIIDAYHQALSQGLTIGTYYHNGLWEDIGDKSSYRQAYIKLFSYFKKKEYKNIEEAFLQLGL